MGGSDPENLEKLINEFPPKENQTIIAFFDRDGSGLKCIKSVFATPENSLLGNID